MCADITTLMIARINVQFTLQICGEVATCDAIASRYAVMTNEFVH